MDFERRAGPETVCDATRIPHENLVGEAKVCCFKLRHFAKLYFRVSTRSSLYHYSRHILSSSGAVGIT